MKIKDLKHYVDIQDVGTVNLHQCKITTRKNNKYLLITSNCVTNKRAGYLNNGQLPILLKLHLGGQINKTFNEDDVYNLLAGNYVYSGDYDIYFKPLETYDSQRRKSTGKLMFNYDNPYDGFGMFDF